eukprot:5682179-Prymnesium_polylepis.2
MICSSVGTRRLAHDQTPPCRRSEGGGRVPQRRPTRAAMRCASSRTSWSLADSRGPSRPTPACCKRLRAKGPLRSTSSRAPVVVARSRRSRRRGGIVLRRTGWPVH